MAVSNRHMREGRSQAPRNLCGRPRDGFTLMQLLVGLALMVIIFSLVFLPLHKSISLTQRGRQTMHMQSTVQHALEQIKGDLSRAIVVYWERAGLNLLDAPGEVDVLNNTTGQPPADGRTDLALVLDDDRFGRLDIVVSQRQLASVFLKMPVPSSRVITYYWRTVDPSIPYNLHPQIENTRALYRAEYEPIGVLSRDVSSATGTWRMADLNAWLQFKENTGNRKSEEGHTAITPEHDTTDVQKFFASIEQIPDGRLAVTVELAVMQADPVQKLNLLKTELDNQEVWFPDPARDLKMQGFSVTRGKFTVVLPRGANAFPPLP